jgi:hypothetical protein
MKAILWDGNKQLNGELEIRDSHLQFIFHDFRETDLSLEIPYDAIDHVAYTKVYGIKPKAIAIHSKHGNSNVFVVEDTKTLKEKLETTLLFNQTRSKK